MKTALLVIDLQRWYLERGHPEKLSRVGVLIAKTNELIDFFHQQSLPVVQIRLIHKKDGSTWNQMMKPHWTGRLVEGTLTEGTWEAEPHPKLHGRDTDLVLTKTRGGAFLRTKLEDILREQGVGTVVLAGYSTNRCVGLTAIDAWERDFSVMLASEAIMGTNSVEGEWMLDYLRRAFDIEPLSNTEIEATVSKQNLR